MGPFDFPSLPASCFSMFCRTTKYGHKNSKFETKSLRKASESRTSCHRLIDRANASFNKFGQLAQSCGGPTSSGVDEEALWLAMTATDQLFCDDGKVWKMDPGRFLHC